MLLFVDESGHDRESMPYEVLAGIAVSEDNLWNLVRSVRGAEREHFGDYLRNLRGTELKAKGLLKRKRFRSAARAIEIGESELATLAQSALQKGLVARREGQDRSSATERELVAYSRSVLRFVHAVLDIAAQHNVEVLALIVDRSAARPASGKLRKDYVYLFERYFYLLERYPPATRGLVVFDELDRSKAHILIQQMAAYFLGTETGKFRSARVVPEPFFVHSELTTGIFLADLAAYILGWAWRLAKMTRPARIELKAYADKLHDMQFKGEKPDLSSGRSWPLYGLVYLDDLRGQFDRAEADEAQK